jgi:hypothetical protein
MLRVAIEDSVSPFFCVPRTRGTALGEPGPGLEVRQCAAEGRGRAVALYAGVSVQPVAARNSGLTVLSNRGKGLGGSSLVGPVFVFLVIPA